MVYYFYFIIFDIIINYINSQDCKIIQSENTISNQKIFYQYGYKNMVIFGMYYSPYNVTKYKIDENGKIESMWNTNEIDIVLSVWMNDNITVIGVYNTHAKIIINDNLSNSMNISSDIKSLGLFAHSVSIIQNNNISLILVSCRDLSTIEYGNIK